MVIDLSWVFHMLEHEVDGKDVHVLEDSPNSNPPAHCQVSDDDDLLFYFFRGIIKKKKREKSGQADCLG